MSLHFFRDTSTELLAADDGQFAITVPAGFWRFINVKIRFTATVRGSIEAWVYDIHKSRVAGIIGSGLQPAENIWVSMTDEYLEIEPRHVVYINTVTSFSGDTVEWSVNGAYWIKESK